MTRAGRRGTGLRAFGPRHVAGAPGPNLRLSYFSGLRWPLHSVPGTPGGVLPNRFSSMVGVACVHNGSPARTADRLQSFLHIRVDVNPCDPMVAGEVADTCGGELECQTAGSTSRVDLPAGQHPVIDRAELLDGDDPLAELIVEIARPALHTGVAPIRLSAQR